MDIKWYYFSVSKILNDGCVEVFIVEEHPDDDDIGQMRQFNDALYELPGSINCVFRGFVKASSFCYAQREIENALQ